MPNLATLVDLLNTLDLRTYAGAAGVFQRDTLSSPVELGRWLAERGELEPGAVVGDAEWALVIRVREGLRAVVDSTAAGVGVRSFEEPSLCFGVRVDATAGPSLELQGAATSRALGRFLALAVAAGIDGTWWRVKTCAAEDCRRVFYDSSKNRSARWCSSRVCGNRVKTRSYRHRRSQSPDPLQQAAATPPQGRSSLRTNVFRLEGEYWRIVYARKKFQLRDSKGLGYVARMLAEPGREWHVLDLVTLDAGPDLPPPRVSGLHVQRGGDAGPMLDAAAKQAYRLRIHDLDDEIEEAQAWGDAERAARAKDELEIIAREVSRAMGLGGRDRKAASDVEHARINVTRVIKAALVRIGEHSPELKHHLSSTVRTGTFCCYDPDPRLPVSWRF